jgi:hypothetical protein
MIKSGVAAFLLCTLLATTVRADALLVLEKDSQGAAGILIAPEGPRAFVAVSGGGKVAVIDLHSFAVSGHIAPMGQPDGLAWVGAGQRN